MQSFNLQNVTTPYSTMKKSTLTSGNFVSMLGLQLQTTNPPQLRFARAHHARHRLLTGNLMKELTTEPQSESTRLQVQSKCQISNFKKDEGEPVLWHLVIVIPIASAKNATTQGHFVKVSSQRFRGVDTDLFLG